MSDKIADYSHEALQTESPFFASAYAPDTLIKGGGKYQFIVLDTSFLPAIIIDTVSSGTKSASAPEMSVGIHSEGHEPVNNKPSYTPGLVDGKDHNGQDHSGNEHEDKSRVDRGVASGSAELAKPAQPVDDTDFFDGCWNVVSDLAEGAYEDIVEHPIETAVKVVVGVGVGVAAAFVAPVVVVGAAVGATIGVGYEAYEHGGEWCDSIGKVANPEDYSAAEVDEAHKAVKGMGAVVADVALGALTGAAGSALAGVVSSAVRGATGAEVSSVVSGAARGSAEGDVVATVEAGIARGSSAAAEAPAAVEAGAARAVAADSAAADTVAVDSATGNTAAATRHFPAEPPSGGKYIEIKVPNDDVIDPNLPLLEREMEELWGPQVTIAIEDIAFRIANPEALNAELESLSVTGSAVRLAQTANNWAVALEERMAAGEPLTKELVDRAFKWVNVDDRFDWLVASVLKEAWVFGKQLNEWYE
ncbi:hypothetical protein BH11CYA1_BH11CYA1_39700 [soil metagenome]